MAKMTAVQLRLLKKAQTYADVCFNFESIKDSDKQRYCAELNSALSSYKWTNRNANIIRKAIRNLKEVNQC